MPKLNIDGKEIEVPKGTKVIEAAKQCGIDVPYYCYHPGLSIAGNCRMCLVEVEKTPKLQIACHTEAQDGMIVKTNTEKVLKTRQHVLEFLLVNHPVDCPVCDQAGECWLQDYYMKHGLHDSRLNENKVKKKKAVPLGPTVMLDAERCVLCSRCVRFCDEISKTSELGIVNRGDHGEIATFPGKELSNAYSGNVVDICPVGALTDRDFRFKVRVWYLKSADSICNGCSRGCNIQVHYNLDRPHHNNGERIARLKPRYNELVNKWWMCDDGRYGYKYHNQNRLLKPLLREQETISDISWEKALSEIAGNLKTQNSSIGILLSPQMSNEELFLARELFIERLKLPNVYLVSPNPCGIEDDLLRKADKNPNTKGAELLGFSYQPEKLKEFFSSCDQGKIEGVLFFGQDLLTLHGAHLTENAFKKLKWSAFAGSNPNLTSEYALWALPSSTHFEKEGTFTNFEGRIQKFDKVVEPLGESISDWKIIMLLAEKSGNHFSFENEAATFHEMSLKEEAFKNLSYETLHDGTADIRTTAMPTIPALEQGANIL